MNPGTVICGGGAKAIPCCREIRMVLECEGRPQLLPENADIQCTGGKPHALRAVYKVLPKCAAFLKAAACQQAAALGYRKCFVFAARDIEIERHHGQAFYEDQYISIGDAEPCGFCRIFYAVENAAMRGGALYARQRQCRICIFRPQLDIRPRRLKRRVSLPRR